eukprot:4263273-Pyramimonas_sp.AAC.1
MGTCGRMGVPARAGAFSPGSDSPRPYPQRVLLPATALVGMGVCCSGEENHAHAPILARPILDPGS